MLPWIVLLAPLVSALLILLVTGKSKVASSGISVLAVIVSFIGSLVLFFGNGGENIARLEWATLPDFGITIGFTIDELSKAMLLVVTGIGLLVHVYSLGYMKEDAGKARFFGGLSLFMFSMLGIVLADNFIMMFIFWELVGVSSYLLIGHWYERPAAADAAKKAFITNRVGDFGFLLGILMVWALTGSVFFSEIQEFLGANTLNTCLITAAGLLVFCGTIGKSAQFPLHVWLPDAMEGPTPVSALIHAATMVAAGVYMLARSFFLFEASATTLNVIAIIGVVTAVLAALMATQQNDIKRILAYSTLSQLGYMVMAVGLAAAGAAMFHLITHAFFKALLFLGSGAVIYGMHHEQDIWKMGGLKNKMPITFLTFGIGTLALIGFPFVFSGFWSKDAILVAAYAKHPLFFWPAVITAGLTAFYMVRLYVVTFLNHPNSEDAKKAHEAPMSMTVPLILLAIPSVIIGYPFIMDKIFHVPHEQVPTIVMVSAIGMFVLGSLAGFVLYRGKEKDPISIPLLANKFYIDEFYGFLVKRIQGGFSNLLGAFDRLFIDGLLVRGLGGLTWGVGYVLRCIQVGNLQAYAFMFGLGVIALLYFILFR